MYFKIHEVFWSFFISIGLIYSDHSFWLIVAVSFFLMSRLKHNFIFILIFLALLMHQKYLEFKKEHLIICENYRCFLKNSIFNDQIKGFNKKNGLYLFKGVLKKTRSKILRPTNEYEIILTEVINKIADKRTDKFIGAFNHFFKNSLLKKIYQSFFMGIFPKNETWFQILAEMNLLHALCLSGMHINFLYKICLKRKIPFFTVSFGFLFLLDFAFPLTRAFLKKIFELYGYNKEDSFWLAIFLASIIKPVCIFSFSFWLTVYFSCLIEFKEISLWALKIGGVGWAIEMGNPISPFLMIIGIFIEPIIYYAVYPLLILGIPFLFFQTTSIIFSNIIENFLPLLCKMKNFSYLITIDSSKGLLLMIIPFVFLSTKFHTVLTKIGSKVRKKGSFE